MVVVLWHEFDRLTSQVFGRGTAMPVDAYRDGEQVVVAVDLPGVAVEDIDVTVAGSTVTVQAERPPLRVGDGARIQVRERPCGVFARQFHLGDPLDASRVQAAYDNGVLVLRVPFADGAAPRRVTVQRAISPAGG